MFTWIVLKVSVEYVGAQTNRQSRLVPIFKCCHQVLLCVQDWLQVVVRLIATPYAVPNCGKVSQVLIKQTQTTVRNYNKERTSKMTTWPLFIGTCYNSNTRTLVHQLTLKYMAPVHMHSTHNTTKVTHTFTQTNCSMFTNTKVTQLLLNCLYIRQISNINCFFEKKYLSTLTVLKVGVE